NDADERADVLGDPAIVFPEQVARHCVHGLDAIEREGRGRREHHAVVHDGRHLLIAQRAAGEYPLRHELLDVAGVDLIERTVAPPGIRPVVHEPVGGVTLRLEQAVLGHVTPFRGGGRRWQERHESDHDEHKPREWAHTFSVMSLLVEWLTAVAGASPPPDPRAGMLVPLAERCQWP